MATVAHLPAPDWRAALKHNKKDLVTAEVGNAFLLLTNDELQGCIAYDSFSERIFWSRTPPAMRGFDPPTQGKPLQDHDLVYLQHYFSKICEYQVSFKSTTLDDALRAAARKNEVHPLRSYLRGLTWKKEELLGKWCHECLGCPSSSYASAVGTWWMISAVARALESGCQADHMLLLEGAQGARKSTALRILAGEWYLPELPDVRSKDAAQVLHGRWIVECGELAAMRRQGMTDTAIKDFMTRLIDIYRPAYGKNVVHRPRSVVFAGTTNDFQSLTDATGGRRYWPIACASVDVKKLTAWRDQLWAEAVYKFERGDQWHPTEDLAPEIEEEQEQRYIGDSWEDRVLAWADSRVLPFGAADILGGPLGIDAQHWNRSAETRVGAILNRARYVVSRPMINGRRVTQYCKPMREPGEDDE